jgi:hypothetical protein
MSQRTRVGDAVAVADSPGTLAVASSVAQDPGSSQSQVESPTSWSAPISGDMAGRG